VTSSRRTQEAVAHLEDGGCGFGEDFLVELVVVHGEAGAGEELEDAAVLDVAEEPALVGERRGVGHVDGDGVAVAEGRLWDELVER